jgi:hypothetical protein
MLRRLLFLSLAPFAVACAGAPLPPPVAGPSLEIRLAHDSRAERATRHQLEALLARYDLGPWLFTRAVLIDERAIPHSHPVLTLHTRHAKDDLLLLSTFVHEEIHWFLAARRDALAEATADLRRRVPPLPLGFPDGADSDASNYEHLLVITLEEDGVQRLAGELAAHDVMTFWATDHYRALYRAVTERRELLWEVLRTHGLVPPR